MNTTSRGECLCGGVSFEVSGSIDGFFLCHCRRCRKDTGSAHAANLFSANATIIWKTGKELVRTFRLPGTRHQKSFCSTCGSAVPSIDADSGMMTIPAGCLDSPVSLRPDAHICCVDRAEWDRQLEQVPTFAGLPEPSQ